MAISAKDKARYITQINSVLDNIYIEKLEDFQLVVAGLRNILDPTTAYHIEDKFKDIMGHVANDLCSPEMWVENPMDYAEYQGIIRERIYAKITELESLSNNRQKTVYIQEQGIRRAHAAENQKKMSERLAPEPGSDAHTVTEAQHLADLQRRWHVEQGRIHSSEFDFSGDVSPSDVPLTGAMFELSTGVRNLISDYISQAEVAPHVQRSFDRPGRDDMAELFAAMLCSGLFSTTDMARMMVEYDRHSVRDLEIQRERNRALDLAVRQGAGLFSIADISGMGYLAVQILGTEACIEPMREGLFGIADIKDMSVRAIRELIQPSCIDALREGRKTIGELSHLSADELHQINNEPGRRSMP